MLWIINRSDLKGISFLFSFYALVLSPFFLMDADNVDPIPSVYRNMGIFGSPVKNEMGSPVDKSAKKNGSVISSTCNA